MCHVLSPVPAWNILATYRGTGVSTVELSMCVCKRVIAGLPAHLGIPPRPLVLDI